MPNTRQAFQEALLERSKKEKAMTGIHVGFFRTVEVARIGGVPIWAAAFPETENPAKGLVRKNEYITA